MTNLLGYRLGRLTEKLRAGNTAEPMDPGDEAENDSSF